MKKQQNVVKMNNYIINSDIVNYNCKNIGLQKEKIKYLQINDPHNIWDSKSLSNQFKIPIEAIMYLQKLNKK